MIYSKFPKIDLGLRGYTPPYASCVGIYRPFSRTTSDDSGDLLMLDTARAQTETLDPKKTRPAVGTYTSLLAFKQPLTR